MVESSSRHLYNLKMWFMKLNDMHQLKITCIENVLALTKFMEELSLTWVEFGNVGSGCKF